LIAALCGVAVVTLIAWAAILMRYIRGPLAPSPRDELEAGRRRALKIADVVHKRLDEVRLQAAAARRNGGNISASQFEQAVIELLALEEVLRSSDDCARLLK